ncbi:MAG: hypothetical protein ACRDZZ_05905, partial [Ilumatobacteraceae bacterium]
MDEHELSRRVVDSARGEMRSGFGDELWSEMEAEFEGAAVPHAPRPETRVRRRRWVTAGAAAAIIAVAGTIALWPHDESTLRDVGGVETSVPPVATTLPPPITSVAEVTSTTAPAPSTTEPPPVFVAPDEWRVALRVGGGQPLEALAVAG